MGSHIYTTVCNHIYTLINFFIYFCPIGSSIPKIAVTDDIVANHGDKISLTCNVTDRGLKNAAVLKEITWMKEGEILERVKNPNPDDPEGTLRPFVIDSVETEDGGLYICVLLVLLKKQTQKNITGNVNISGAFFILTFEFSFVVVCFVCMFVLRSSFMKPHKHNCWYLKSFLINLKINPLPHV